MGKACPRMCSLCHQTAIPGKSRCPQHLDKEKRHDRERGKTDLRKLYKTPGWRAARLQALSNEPICQRVDNGVRCPQLATTVHHRVDARVLVGEIADTGLTQEQWERFLDLTNLECLCKPHHDQLTAKQHGWGTR